MGLQQIFIHRR